MARNLWVKEMPLLSAEAKVVMSASRGGDLGRVMLEVFPYPHSGNAPGMLSRYMLHWKKALEFAIGLKAIQDAIKNGVDVVPGTRYAPVMFNLGQGGEWDPGLRLVLTQEDCETWAHLLTDGAKFASEKPGLIVGHRGR